MMWCRAALCLCALFLAECNPEEPEGTSGNVTEGVTEEATEEDTEEATEEEDEVTEELEMSMSPEEEYAEAVRVRGGSLLEITGIPETQNEDLTELVKKYGRLIGADDVNCVKEARRFRKPGTDISEKKTYIVVDMIHETYCHEWIRRCQEHREVTAELFDESSGRTEIFVIDYVPHRTKELLIEARRWGKDHGYVIIWCKGNYTYLKKPGGKQLKVASMKEFRTLIEDKAL